MKTIQKIYIYNACVKKAESYCTVMHHTACSTTSYLIYFFMNDLWKSDRTVSLMNRFCTAGSSLV